MNRAEIKETAKSYVRQNNNHGGMVGVEILYNLLFDAATAAIISLTVVTSFLSGIASFVSSAISSLTAAVGISSTFVSLLTGGTLARYGIMIVLAAPVQIGLIRYYLRIVETNRRPKVVSVFDPFENYKNVVRVCWSEWIRTTLLPSVVSAVAGALIAVAFGATAIVQAVLSYGRDLSGLAMFIFLMACVSIACLALSIYMWYKTWAMRWILAENHDAPVDQVLAQSAQITEGHFWELVVFELSFVGWRFLRAITFGLVGVFYVDPYYHMSCALLYQELKKSPVKVISATDDFSQVDSDKLVSYLHYLENQIQKVENMCSQNQDQIYDLKVKVWRQLLKFRAARKKLSYPTIPSRARRLPSLAWPACIPVPNSRSSRIIRCWLDGTRRWCRLSLQRVQRKSAAGTVLLCSTARNRNTRSSITPAMAPMSMVPSSPPMCRFW